MSAKKTASEGRLPEALVLLLSMCVPARLEIGNSGAACDRPVTPQLLCLRRFISLQLLSDLVQVRLLGIVFCIGDAWFANASVEFLNRTREEREIEVQAWYGMWSSGGRHTLRQCILGTCFSRSGFTCQAPA
jgi:hypothetical protein